LKKYLLASLILIILISTSRIASAQEGGETWPEYIIQSGDTLYSISLRFNVAVNDLIIVNAIENPDQLLAGDRLLLPGVDWIQGLIDPRRMPFGDSLRSLSRRYRVSLEDLARLNRLTSPGQLYVGYPVLFPIERGEDLSLGRKVLAPQMSLLELAVLSNANPWTVVAMNQLSGTWQAVPGDILLQPGVSQTGPGGLPSPISQVEVIPSPLAQGDTAVIRVSSEEEFSLEGQLAGYPLHFFSNNGENVALQGIHALLEPGFYPISIAGSFGDGVDFGYTQTIQIKDGGYGFETLTVKEELLDPQLSEQELEFISTFTTQVTPDKYWVGYFSSPSPNNDGINSFYGTRRSYNAGFYESWHSGVDFGGGQGLPVFAPARGKVVFADFLEVRGNTTIIDHGWGIFTVYIHQLEIQVQVGDFVEPAQVIGIVGNTGRSSGAHLHWEVWAGGVQVQPLDWLAILYP
jgi:murein DD-endopeptidase MepM/ murein hydrolase activator NlpD